MGWYKCLISPGPYAYGWDEVGPRWGGKSSSLPLYHTPKLISGGKYGEMIATAIDHLICFKRDQSIKDR